MPKLKAAIALLFDELGNWNGQYAYIQAKATDYVDELVLLSEQKRISQATFELVEIDCPPVTAVTAPDNLTDTPPDGLKGIIARRNPGNGKGALYDYFDTTSARMEFILVGEPQDFSPIRALTVPVRKAPSDAPASYKNRQYTQDFPPGDYTLYVRKLGSPGPWYSVPFVVTPDLLEVIWPKITGITFGNWTPATAQATVAGSQSLPADLATAANPLRYNLLGDSPPWMSLSGTTLSYTPPAPGEYAFVVYATDDVAGKNANAVFVLVVTAAPAGSLPLCVEAENMTGSGSALSNQGASGGQAVYSLGNNQEGRETTLTLEAGRYPVTIRYAVSGESRAGIRINGGSRQEVVLPSTSGRFAEVTTTMDLPANPTLRVEGTNGQQAFVFDRTCIGTRSGDTSEPGEITQFQVETERMSNQSKATLNVISRRPVRIRITGQGGYDSGFQPASYLSDVSNGFENYRYVGPDTLPAGSYQAYVEDVQDATIKKEFTFTAPGAATGTQPAITRVESRYSDEAGPTGLPKLTDFRVTTVGGAQAQYRTRIRFYGDADYRDWGGFRACTTITSRGETFYGDALQNASSVIFLNIQVRRTGTTEIVADFVVATQDGYYDWETEYSSGGTGGVNSGLINQIYGNTVVTSVPSSDSSVMNISLYVDQNGRVRANDTSGRVAGPGEQMKYLINNRYFDDIAQWNGPKGVPHLFMKFIAPAGRPLSALRDNPVIEACQQAGIY